MCLIWAVFTIWANHMERSHKAEILIKTIRFLAAAASFLLIVYITLLSREPGLQREPVVEPFHSIELASENKIIIKEKLLNVYLFMPLGLIFPAALNISGKRKTAVLLTFSFAAVLSATIELLQFYLALGLAETDDIIANITGAGIGIIVWMIITRNNKIQ